MSSSESSKIAIVLPTQNSQFIDPTPNLQAVNEHVVKSPIGEIVPLTQEQALEQHQNQSAIVQTQQICNQEALELLKRRTGYPIIQENGQRKYGPPPNWMESEPDRACEVFVGKIPRDCFEDELIPVLERVGFIYEFRLMMEYSGYNRGYGFVMYTSREHARKAVNELNNFEIRKNRMIGLCRSVDNCRLFVGGIPKNKKREEILEEMKKVTDDVVNVIVYPSANDKSKNRGFAFVQYTNHRAAAVARRKLIPARIHLFGQPIAVDWAEPEPEVDDDVMKTVKVLYVRNLMLTTTEELIKSEFEKIRPNSVERVKKLKDFAFVHFKEREDAIESMKQMNGSSIDGAQVEVTLSKPVDKNNYMRFTRQEASPTNQLLGACLDPNDINNILLGAQLATPHTTAIPAFPQTVSFTDPATQLQYQIPNQQFQALGHLNPLQGTFLPNPNIPNLHSPILSQNQILGGIGNLLPDPSSMINKPGNRIRMTPGSRGAGGIHRSAYYNTIKGVNGGVKRQLSNEDVLQDFYTGVKPVPMLPFNPSGLKYKPPAKVLEEFCLKEGLAQPVYTLHTTSGKDQEGREIGLFLYKVTMPIFGANQLSSNRLMRSLDEAKNDAAEFVLMQLFPQNSGQQPSTTPNLTGDILPEANGTEKTSQTQVYHQPQVSSTPSKNSISVTEQNTNGLFQQPQQAQANTTLGTVIPGTSTAEYMQPTVAPQYFLDPSGQYLMYPTPGWQ